MSSGFRSGLEGAEVSWPEITKFIFQNCCTFFTRWHLVYGPGFTHTCSSGHLALNQHKRWHYRTFLYTSAPTLSPGLKNYGGIFFLSGVMTPMTMIWAVCFVQKPPLTSTDLAMYLSICLLTTASVVCTSS